ncbi:NADPH-dependent ferric siderophore reductase, contains FAD-binding and SIP domains [Promicromonospora umidemergens]|uniref:Siderophore-interacting protein n=1 Tax=Promicromonospora umidemergens TaxID=629679 RepID=A0ABP8X9E4_9MICO|nr:siderophore-interacting protein [Promicromonospora umidemergens]MCP2281289.1 NADPH-dependent ferric siderophore reductase, contains FAD-binding and SIP domains [Promicromonospora umidemergens]
MAHKGRKAVDPHVVMADVVNTKRVTPNMMRVTLGGDELAQLTPVGYDQWFRLFLPRAGQDMLRLPTRTSGLWYAEYLTTPKARRPWVRNYTVRAARPDLNEIDVDFVLHAGPDDAPGDTAEHGPGGASTHGSGPGAGFAQAAEPGLRVGILDQGISYDPRHAHDWTLLVADESGLPAVAGICESLPEDARGIAVIEVPTAGDKQEFRAPSGVELRWVVRSDGDPHAVPGQAALAELRGLDLAGLGTEVYAFTVGESSLATGARRYLVNECGVPKAYVDFVGYWRHGRSAPG